VSEDTAESNESPGSSAALTVNQSTKFYVVAPRKFWLLYMLTLGFYGIAWFYQNWVHFKRATRDDDIWPAPRALFNIFFAHSLGRMVEASIMRDGTDYDWDSTPAATTYVIVTVVAGVCDRLAWNHIGTPTTDFIPLLLLPVAGWQLFSFQQAINVASHDPLGTSNSRMNWVNWIWLGIGTLLTLFAVYGAYLSAIGEI
jgi:hypothetical protein